MVEKKKTPKKPPNKRHAKTLLKREDHVDQFREYSGADPPKTEYITDLDAALYTVYFTRGLALLTMHINVNFRHNRLNGETLLNSAKTGNLSPESTDRWKLA